jgi:hypothetical protein
MRSPVTKTIKLSADVPRGEDFLWPIILDLDRKGEWTVGAVVGRAAVTKSIATLYVRRLCRGGFARQVTLEAKGFSHRFRLLKRPGLAPHLRPNGKEKMDGARRQLWRAMKMLKSFTVADLVEHCPDVSARTASHYCNRLADASILIAGHGSFRFLRNLGSDAPKLMVTSFVFDPNSGEMTVTSAA